MCLLFFSSALLRLTIPYRGELCLNLQSPFDPAQHLIEQVLNKSLLLIKSSCKSVLITCLQMAWPQSRFLWNHTWKFNSFPRKKSQLCISFLGYQTPGGVEQQKCVLPQFWRSQGRLRSRCLHAWSFLTGGPASREGESITYLCWLRAVCWQFLLILCFHVTPWCLLSSSRGLPVCRPHSSVTSF